MHLIFILQEHADKALQYYLSVDPNNSLPLLLVGYYVKIIHFLYFWYVIISKSFLLDASLTCKTNILVCSKQYHKSA